MHSSKNFDPNIDGDGLGRSGILPIVANLGAVEPHDKIPDTL